MNNFKFLKQGGYRFLLTFILFLTLSQVYIVDASVKQSVNLISREVPQEAVDYAKSIAPKMLANIVGNEESYGVEIRDYDDVSLGKPYTILSLDSSNTNDIIYYFPVVEENKIDLIISVYQNLGEWNATISKDISDEINSLASNKADNDYIIYYENGSIFAQSDNQKKLLFEDRFIKNDKIKDSAMSYQDKLDYYESCIGEDNLTVSDLDNSIKNAEKIGKEAVQLINKNRVNAVSLMLVYADNGYSTNTATTKLLNTTGCRVNQKDSSGEERGMCWAASVATTVRYMTGNRSLTAAQVCNLMGIGYDDGGTVIDKQNALKKYGLYFMADYSQVSWSTVKNAINYRRPILMSTKSRTGWHAVTLVGYSTANSTNTITLWNSGNQQLQTATYTIAPSSTIFTYSSKSYEWKYSLY